jgi:DNA-binding transcriptional LysR family regulator
MVDITDLQTFVEIADSRGLSAAARRLGVSKSIVSRSLLRLESELGAQLLARTTRGAALTEAGIALRDHAARVCSEMDIARETILPAGDLRGRLRIAAPLSFGPTHLAPILAELARLHPLLHVHTAYSDSLVDVVGEGFDVAVRVGYLTDSNLIARRVGAICCKLVASPAYVEEHGAPDSPEELLKHNALMHGTEVWRCPDFLTDAHMASGALVPVMTRYPLPDAGIYVVRPPGTRPHRKVRVLTELLVESFG